MSNSRKHWFSRLFPPPVFPGDPEKTRVGAVSNDLIGVIVLGYATYGTLALVFGIYNNLANVLFGWTCWAVILLLRLLLSRGWVNSVTFAVAMVIALASMVTVYRLGSISVAHAAWSLVAIVYLVLTLGPRAGVAIMTMTLGFFAWIAVQESTGELVRSSLSRPAYQWVMILTQSIILFAIGALVRRHMVDAVERGNMEHQALEFAREEKRRMLESANRTLEVRVAQRTAELKQANAELQRASQHLIQSEKLAALGGLVAGVAHELNTPIGNARLSATALAARMEDMAAQVRTGRISRSQLEEFFSSGLMSVQLIERATERSGELVESFKQIAVDQTGMLRRQFDLKRTAEQTVMMLSPMLKRTTHEISVDIPPDIQMDGYPGAIEQVINNFVTNALMHAFIGRREGRMRLSATLQATQVEMRFSDDGAGIAADIRPRIFDPFFTTKFGQGGSGLGLYTVYNLVTSVFGGSIKIDTGEGEGARFVLLLPLVSPLQQSENAR